MTKGAILEDPSETTDAEEGLEYASNQSYLTPTLALEDVVAQDTLWFLMPPMEEHQGIRECCQTRVVEYVDDLVEIADDEGSEGSSLLESSSSAATSLPKLEDQENFAIAMV